MTKNKRFQINGKEIIQNKQVWCMANSEHCADVIATAMNELHDENKNLSKLNKILEGFLLDKGYDFKDIIKFIQDKTDGRGDVE